jgi:hypothetical protein
MSDLEIILTVTLAMSLALNEYLCAKWKQAIDELEETIDEWEYFTRKRDGNG